MGINCAPLLVDLFVYSYENDLSDNSLRLRGVTIGRHFHANMKVQTATCKDNNNSKSRAATWVKLEINIK